MGRGQIKVVTLNISTWMKILGNLSHEIAIKRGGGGWRSDTTIIYLSRSLPNGSSRKECMRYEL